MAGNFSATDSKGYNGPVDDTHCLSDSDCINLGNYYHVSDIEACFSTCDSKYQCNAVNWSPSSRNCILRGCEGDHAQHPTNISGDYRTFYKTGSLDFEET